MSNGVFGNLFKNIYAGYGSGANNAALDPNAWSNLDASNLLRFDADQGVTPGIGEQFKLGTQNLGNSAAQNQSMLGFGFNAAKGIFDTYSAFKQNSQMEDMLNFQKQKYQNDLAMSKQMTNMELSDRQRRRVSANPNAESVDNYMSKWGV